jgi:hypothetical protein
LRDVSQNIEEERNGVHLGAPTSKIPAAKVVRYDNMERFGSLSVQYFICSIKLCFIVYVDCQSIETCCQTLSVTKYIERPYCKGDGVGDLVGPARAGLNHETKVLVGLVRTSLNHGTKAPVVIGREVVSVADLVGLTRASLNHDQAPVVRS